MMYDNTTKPAIAPKKNTLSGFGSNLIRNRPVFYSGWHEDGEPGWVIWLISTLVTATIVVAAGLVLVG